MIIIETNVAPKPLIATGYLRDEAISAVSAKDLKCIHFLVFVQQDEYEWLVDSHGIQVPHSQVPSHMWSRPRPGLASMLRGVGELPMSPILYCAIHNKTIIIVQAHKMQRVILYLSSYRKWRITVTSVRASVIT